MNVYELITKKMIEQLEKGVIPWQKPWHGTSLAVSHTNGKPYSLLNQWLLEGISGEWLTFKQVKKEGGYVKKGEKSHMVVFWNFIEKKEKDENGNEVVSSFPILKWYEVFHISQCEGIVEKYPIPEKRENEPIDACEKIVNGYAEFGCEIRREMESNRAYYDCKADYIRVPNISQYEVVEEYYSTLFHEMVHSTGAASRLKREGIVKFDIFGSEQYSKEELIAEMGAAFLCNNAGLDPSKSFNNSAAYIGSWLKKLKNDSKFVVAAAGKAEQAVKYILTGEKATYDK